MADYSIPLGNVKGNKGDTGTRGSLWYTGTAITHTTGTATPATGITGALVGDMYLNTSTSNIYKCTTAGASGVAIWTYLCNIQGIQGVPGLLDATELAKLNGNFDLISGWDEAKVYAASATSLGYIIGDGWEVVSGSPLTWVLFHNYGFRLHGRVKTTSARSGSATIVTLVPPASDAQYAAQILTNGDRLALSPSNDNLTLTWHGTSLAQNTELAIRVDGYFVSASGGLNGQFATIGGGDEEDAEEEQGE